MERYGSNIGGLHSYYKCQHCNKFTEYHLSTKNNLIISIAAMLITVFILATTFALVETNSWLALLFFLASILLSSTFIYKYRLYGLEKIALSHLPDDPWIIRPPKRKTGLIITAIFIAVVAVVLIMYVGFIILIIIRNWKT